MDVRDATEIELLREFMDKLHAHRSAWSKQFAHYQGGYVAQAEPVVDTSALEDVPPVTLAQAIEEAKAEVKVPSDVEIMQLMTAAQQRGVGIPRITELRGPVRVTQMTPEQRIEFVAKLAKEGR